MQQTQNKIQQRVAQIKDKQGQGRANNISNSVPRQISVAELQKRVQQAKERRAQQNSQSKPQTENSSEVATTQPTVPEKQATPCEIRPQKETISVPPQAEDPPQVGAQNQDDDNIALKLSTVLLQNDEITAQTDKQLSFCQSLLKKQQELSQSLANSQIQQALDNSRGVLNVNDFVAARNLRPVSAEVPGMNFSYTAPQRAEAVPTAQAPLQAEDDSLDEQYQQICATMRKLAESPEISSGMDQLFYKTEIQQILLQKIRRDSKLSNEILHYLNDSKHGDIQLNRLNNSKLFTFRCHLVGRLVGVFTDGCDGEIVKFEQEDNVLRVECGKKAEQFPIQAEKVCQDINQRGQYYIIANQQVYSLNIVTWQVQLLHSAEKLLLHSYPVQMVHVNRFFQNLGQLNCLLICYNSGVIVLYDLNKQIQYEYKIKKYSTAISDLVFTQFNYFEASQSYLAYASVNGFVGVYDIQQLLNQIYMGQAQNREENIDSMVKYQIFQNIGGIYLDGHWLFVCDILNKVKKYDLEKVGVGNLRLETKFTEMQFEKPICGLLEHKLIDFDGKVYDLDGGQVGANNMENGGGRWEVLSESVVARYLGDQDGVELYDI